MHHAWRHEVVASNSEPKGLIFNIMRFSLHDGPGIRTTVFFKGCPLSCWWCHNPESQRPSADMMYFPDRCVRCGECVAVCPHEAIGWQGGPVWSAVRCQYSGACAGACPSGARELIGEWVTVSQVIAEVVKDTIFFDESRGGVTFSGGEPLMQAGFLDAMLGACRERGIHTTVDTCGVTGRQTLLGLSSKVDVFLCDLKMMDSAKHKKYTGIENEGILENLRALAKRHTGIIVRVPIIPGINDGEDNIEQTRGFLSSAGLWRVDLLPYHEIGTDKYRRLAREYRLEGLNAPTAERMSSIVEQFERDGFRVRIGG